MKTKLFSLLAIALLTSSARDASAYLNIYALANPWINPGGYDLHSTTAGVVEYTIYHEANSNEALSYFDLKFDGSVFSSFGLTGAAINGSALSLSHFDVFTDAVSFDGIEYTNGGFQGLALGSVMTLTFNYSLHGPASSLYWPDGDGPSPWAQSFTGLGEHYNPALRPFMNVGHQDGGSTGLTPEPGTLMLLGSGLASLGFARRYRLRRKNTI
ncbi:MAG: PEP-CTERM sorting domain-containing protein [bacterium]